MESLKSEEDLVLKHKKERKDLQSKIQQLKKTAIKGDKKKKKEVQEEILKLEADLDKKQEEELSKFKPGVDEEDGSVEGEEEIDEIVQDVELMNVGHRVSKAQKRREKKAAEMKEREKRIAEQEIENENSLRTLENQKIVELLKKRKLMIFEVPADGNCLYKAVDHQMKSKLNISFGVDKLRLETSKQLKSDPDKYLPFCSVGDIMTEAEFLEYCDNVANTTNWGGQVEVEALSSVVQHPIEVLQAEGVPLVMGENLNEPVLTLTYHRYLYKLGEHYNSVQPLQEENEI